MSQFKVDATGQLVRENGSFVRVSGVEEIQQHVRVGHRLFAGEVFSNLDLGMRMLGYLLTKDATPDMVAGEFTDSALAKPGVVSMDEITVDMDGATRVATVEYSATISVDDARRRIPIHDRFTISSRG